MAMTSLQDLLGEWPETEFQDRLRRRELTLWRGTGPGRLAGLLSWPTLDGVLDGGGFPAKGLRVTRRGTPLPEPFYVKEGRPDPARIRQLLDHGASVVFSPLDGHVPAIDALVSGIRSGTRDHVRTGAIVTTGPGGAFDLHFDNEDLLIVQLDGSKRWLLHPVPVANAVRGMPTVPAPSRDEVTIDYTLEAGDMLLVPAGFWHHCENGPGRSVHLGVFFVPPSLPRAARRLQRALLADPAARAPLTRGDAAGIDESIVRARLIDAISRMSAADLLDGED
jgi:hypothetical protein